MTTVPFEEFKKVELRAATILEVKDHPNADRLYVLTVDLGDRKKQIVAGIKRYYTKEELVGRQIAIVDNLEPAVLRGEESQGMLLAASDGETVSILVPLKPVAPGSIIK